MVVIRPRICANIAKSFPGGTKFAVLANPVRRNACTSRGVKRLGDVWWGHVSFCSVLSALSKRKKDWERAASELERWNESKEFSPQSAGWWRARVAHVHTLCLAAGEKYFTLSLCTLCACERRKEKQSGDCLLIKLAQKRRKHFAHPLFSMPFIK